MCGIWTYIDLLNNIKNYSKLYDNFIKLKHRGPDLSNYQLIKNNIIIGFHRLGIMDLNFHANQPYIIEDTNRTIVFICNGEIYNFKELIINYNLPIDNNSDCMVIPQLYIKYTKNISNTSIVNFVDLFSNNIKGEFSFILLEFDNLQNLNKILIGRDQIGIRPLYINKLSYTSTTLLISSEIKAMDFYENNVEEFDPGCIMNISIDNFINKMTINKYFFRNIYNINFLLINDESFYLEKIRNAVINSIKRRLLAEKPISFLLSGGVDSSLIASISSKLLNTKINTFCCGMIQGTDLHYARLVANHINSNHTEVFFTKQEGLDAIRDVIYTTETWDTTTIRASVGQYLVCKHIGTKTDAKVVLVGEGPDEVCSSYLFNYYAPNSDELHNTAKEYVRNIHMYDGRRADRCISKWGLEGRIPLLDPEFIIAYWEIPPELRHPKYKNIEKWWLRKAFDSTNLLPNEVLWRKKEAFSDGVSDKEKSWFEIIQDYIKTQVSDDEYKNKRIDAPTIEAYYYKKIFIELFGEKRLNIISNYWQPKWINNSNEYIDPSARKLVDIY